MGLPGRGPGPHSQCRDLLGSKCTLAEVTAVLVDALGSGSTGIALTFIQVHTLEEELELGNSWRAIAISGSK